MKIRLFEESDRASVIALWEACGLTRPWNDPGKDIDRKMSFQPELFFLGELESEVIASAMAGYDGHRGSVFYLAVSPGHQSQGYGHILMQHIERRLISMGCPKLNIVVRSSNLDALGFYSSLSYEPDDVTSLGKRLIPDG
ncbi:MAG: GNAT family acetyltransferase [Pseudomonadota bacterium]